jgi:hypothetical protein
MSECRKCGKQDAEYSFRMLEVQTLHVRDFSRDNRVQALGLFQDGSVCRRCAIDELDKIFHPRKTLIKKLLPFTGVLIFGILVLIFTWGIASAFTVLGIAGILCGILGIGSGINTVYKKKKEYSAMDYDAAERQAAWECMLSVLPKKIGDNDMTYIPIDEKTMKMKNGDLMIVYDLLPDIAVKAWKMIHEED